MTVKLFCKDLQVSFGSYAFIHYHRRQWIIAYMMYLKDIPEEPDDIRQSYKRKFLFSLQLSIRIGKINREEYPDYPKVEFNYCKHFIKDIWFSDSKLENENYKCPFFEGLNIFVSKDIDYDPSPKWTPLEIKSILKTLTTIRKYLKYQDLDNFVVEDECEDEEDDDVYFLEKIFHYAVENNEDIVIDCD